MTANGSGTEIRVFDEGGDMIGTTYPKRARGLVRKGRARWLADTPNTSDPAFTSDSIVMIRNTSGAEAESAVQAPQYRNDTEEITNEFNQNSNTNQNTDKTPSENELRIQGMIEKFQAELRR